MWYVRDTCGCWKRGEVVTLRMAYLRFIGQLYEVRVKRELIFVQYRFDELEEKKFGTLERIRCHQPDYESNLKLIV